MRLLLAISILVSLGAVFNGCQKNDEPVLYDFDLPNDIIPFEQPEYNLATTKGVALGHKLFFDPILSINNQISCASCHQPELSFTDGVSQRKSELTGNILLRNSPTLHNVGFVNSLFWDGGAPNLEFLNAGPITHLDEMGQDIELLKIELNEHSEYPVLFQEAFGLSEIQFADVSNALAQYMRSLVSFNSRYDKWKQGEVDFTNNEQKGYEVYRAFCSSCHSEGLFTDNNFHNNGLDSIFENDTLFGIEKGRYRITGDNDDIGKYRTPSLRNLKFSAPYMHDGRFETLDDVIIHYTTGIKKSPTLDERIAMNLKESGFILSKNEKDELLAFLHTLNDDDFVKNAALSQP